MRRKSTPVLLLILCGSLPGCMFENLASVGSAVSPLVDADSGPTNSFDIPGPVGSHNAVGDVDLRLLREDINTTIAETPVGAQVNVVVDFEHQFTGTLFRTDADSVELMNCIGRDVVPGPNGLPQCRTSHVPFQSIPSERMTRFLVLSPPPPDFRLSDIEARSGAVTIDEIVYKNGVRQRWGRPPDVAGL